MTPRELLNAVKSQFQVMYLSAPLLDTVLQQALRAYQDKAGPVKLLTFADAVTTTAPVPADFLDIAVAMDSEGRWHEAMLVATNLTVTEQIGRSVKPFKVWYFVGMSSMNLETGVLPAESTSVLFDYLTALIEIPNTARAKEVAVTTGIQLELPDEEALKQRKDLLEQEMDECRGIIPMATVY